VGLPVHKACEIQRHRSKNMNPSVIMVIVVICQMTFAMSQTPTPSVSENHQPNCLVGSLAMYSSESCNKMLGLSYWSNAICKSYGAKVTGDITLDMGIKVWNNTFPTNKLYTVYSVSENIDRTVVYNKPYIWVGEYSPKQYHVCMMYLRKDDVILKHIVYNPKTKTNYTEYWDYKKFFEKTLAIYGTKQL